MDNVAENLGRIRQQLREASEREIEIVGVVKKQPVEKLIAAAKSGIRIFGVNYVQEGTLFRESLSEFAMQWHFIGHIQSRKAKDLLNYHCVQSLDRRSVAEDLNRKVSERSATLDVAIEINIGDEPQKSGVPREEAASFFRSLRGLSGLRCVGLMILPPPLEPVEERRRYFRQAKNLFDEFSTHIPLSMLSMGTSDDYLIAAEEGATHVRLGTALFGERRYAPDL